MDPEDSDPFEGPVHIPDQDSGSDYENSCSDHEWDHDRESHDQKIPAAKSRLHGVKDTEVDLEPKDNAKKKDQYNIDEIREKAIKWAAAFVPPREEDIATPERSTSLHRSRKRTLSRVNGTEVRSKRLKGFYSHDYRDLLNIEIIDAGKRSIHEDNIPLEASQIGSSTWSVEEKNDFFTGLARMGKDDVRTIAARVRTKSEVEVQEYIQVLDQAYRDKKSHGTRLLEQMDFPIALEITPECSTIMERAADALAIRQERYEEDIEKAKWGNNWLLTEDVCKSLEGKRKLQPGEENIEEILPAANLLNLRNWLILSENIFMNSSEPRQEDNWREVGEPGETPAVRATAFEDFHSLAVSITKRIVSTVLFCTMSRMRATGSTKAIQADVGTSDVEAALKILKMAENSNDFWIKCARRNNLAVSDPEDDSIMTYEGVENELRKPDESRSKSRSRSRSRCPYSSVPPTNDHTSASESSSTDLSSESDYDIPAQRSDDSFPFSQPSQSQPQSQSQSQVLNKHLTSESYELALEAHVSALDAKASAAEERRIWRLLRQAPPFDLNDDEEEVAEKPRGRSDSEGRDAQDWRKREVWSEWEAVGGKVAEEDFVMNEQRMRRRRRRRMDRERGREMERGAIGDASGEEYVGESENNDAEDEARGGSGLEDIGAGSVRDEYDVWDGPPEDDPPQTSPLRRSYAVYNSDE
ncbi:RNA polymerase i-specific transcription initiation factor rrn5 protein [Rutstroemia sp. NJR-2017a BBW]|nr:RNA polymerase i-specific transcription initiation factor rrn5 protein [Rutstroemia sp. NJR-2017a BBW]